MVRRLPPPRYSVTTKGTASWPQSNTAMTLGWLSAAAAWASARNRRRKASSSDSPSWRILTATRRRRVTSSARYTVADAPVPMGASSRYRSERTCPTRSVKRDNAMATG